MIKDKKIFLEILDKKQLEIFKLLNFTKKEFYLAGGTALALQMGHRKSIDFDFFANEKFDVNELIIKLQETFKGYKLDITRQSDITLNLEIDKVKMSFFFYHYQPIENLIELEELNMVTMMDIACMKCSAITSRSVKKDYIDLSFLLRKFSLREILFKCKIKFPMLDTSVILKSIIYFEEVEPESVVFLRGNEVSFEKVKKSLIDAVKNYTIK